jgi:hypothetical protein
MTASEILDQLKTRGASVEIHDGRLKIAAAPGVLDKALLDQATQHKAELLQLLDHENHVQEYSEKPDQFTPTATRIRELAKDVSAEELLAATAQIKPKLKQEMSAEDLHEMALMLVHAQRSKQSKTVNC